MKTMSRTMIPLMSRLALMALLFSAAPVSADLIRFKDGGKLRGKVLRRSATEVIVQLEFGTMSFSPDEIIAVEEGEGPAAKEERQGPVPVEETRPAQKDVSAGGAVPEAPKEAEDALTLQDAMKAVAFIKVVTHSGGEATATGTIINPHGVMLTNHHVIQDAKTVFVTLPLKGTGSRFKDPTQYEATVLKSDAYYDLALIDIHAKTPEYLRFAQDEEIQVGNEVKAIGNPLGLAVTVSQGITSGVRTNRDLGRPYKAIPGEYVNEREFEEMTWIQTDASINPGNSGGPMLNTANEIVGINTWIATETGGSVGLGFALHVKHVKKFAAGYIRKSRQRD